MRRIILVGIMLLVCFNPVSAATEAELAAMNSQALSFQFSGEFEKAARILQATLKEAGPDTLARLNMLHNLGAVYHDLGQYSKSQALFEQSLEMNERLKLVDDSASTLAYLSHIAFIRHDEAAMDRYLDKALQTRKTVYGESHWMYAITLSDVGEMQRKAKRFEQSEKSLKRAVQIFESTLGRNHIYAMPALFHLGETYRLQNRYADALPLYQESIAIMIKAHGPSHPRLTPLYQAAAMVSSKLKNKEEAKQYDRLADALDKRTFDRSTHTVDVNALMPRK